MEPGRTNHIPEDSLESYSMNRLDEPELAEVEEHLLVCADCRNRVEGSDRYVSAMRAAALSLRQEEPARPALYAWRRPASAIACAAALVMVGLWIGSRNVTSSVVILRASRGQDAVASQVPAGTPFHLSMDLTDAASFPSYRVEVVDIAGRRRWEGAASVRNGQALASAPVRLSKGHYFVRLYSPASELLREYGLEAD